jgi:hypothetical protein
MAETVLPVSNEPSNRKAYHPANKLTTGLPACQAKSPYFALFTAHRAFLPPNRRQRFPPKSV